ncbi:hypothetical protein [Microcystis aeruginosa]|uniref:hypothetical protein n=1 Tax=Microcystis aeruginosa TaxID=1126 RepID=UPI001292FB34|nr:hypothetical protein [Microcystis aeruginosa]
MDKFYQKAYQTPDFVKHRCFSRFYTVLSMFFISRKRVSQRNPFSMARIGEPSPV